VYGAAEIFPVAAVLFEALGKPSFVNAECKGATMKRRSTFVLSFIALVVLSAGGANAQVGRTACADFSGLAVGRHQLPMKFPAPAARGYILVVSDFCA